MEERLDSENTKTRRFERVQNLAWCDIVASNGRVIIERIQNGVDHVLRKEVAGFRKNKSTIDQMFLHRNIIEQVNEWEATFYTHFVDFVEKLLTLYTAKDC